MRVLLDTQSWLWMQVQPAKLSREAHSLVSDTENELFLSAASAWEIAVKHALGKLSLPVPPLEYVPDRMRSSGVLPLVIRHEHALRVAALPPHHRDPFDRLLIAQAQVEDLPVLTSDRVFARYDIAVLWVS